jgi:hypothetical protein
MLEHVLSLGDATLFLTRRAAPTGARDAVSRAARWGCGGRTPPRRASPAPARPRGRAAGLLILAIVAAAALLTALVVILLAPKATPALLIGALVVLAVVVVAEVVLLVLARPKRTS